MIHLIIIVNILNLIKVPNGKSISELNLTLSNPSILFKITLFSIYSRKVLETLITIILLLSITKYHLIHLFFLHFLVNFQHLNIKASRYLYPI